MFITCETPFFLWWMWWCILRVDQLSSLVDYRVDIQRLIISICDFSVRWASLNCWSTFINTLISCCVSISYLNTPPVGLFLALLFLCHSSHSLKSNLFVGQGFFSTAPLLLLLQSPELLPRQKWSWFGGNLAAAGCNQRPRCLAASSPVDLSVWKSFGTPTLVTGRDGVQPRDPEIQF